MGCQRGAAAGGRSSRTESPASSSSGRRCRSRPRPSRARAATSFDEELDSYDGWAKYNRNYWLRDYADFLSFFFSQIFTEPHSTKQIEDCVGWGLQTTPETLIATQLAPGLDETTARELAGRVRCPVLVIHGLDDAIRSHESGATLAELTGGTLVSLDGSGHAPHARDPVKVNLLLRDFVAPVAARSPLGARPVAPQARVVHLVADRARSREARHGDRRRAAQAAPRPRDRLARAASGHLCARGARRADPRGQRAARERVAPHRMRVGGARPPLLPGVAADGRDPARELHGLPRHRARRRVRPLDRGRGVGARLLPAREPGAEDRRLRVADRLRRLAADARRRRARGVPHGGLQRRDDRAHRAPPAHPGPGDLRRRRRRRRPGPLRRRAAADPRLDRAALRLRRVRDRLRPGRARRPRAAASRARVRAGRAGLRRHRRRLRRRREPAAPGHRRLPGGQAARARPADDRRRRAAHRPRLAAASRTGSKSARTSPTCTGCSPHATSPSCRAG